MTRKQQDVSSQIQISLSLLLRFDMSVSESTNEYERAVELCVPMTMLSRYPAYRPNFSIEPFTIQERICDVCGLKIEQCWHENIGEDGEWDDQVHRRSRTYSLHDIQYIWIRLRKHMDEEDENEDDDTIAIDNMNDDDAPVYNNQTSIDTIDTLSIASINLV